MRIFLQRVQRAEVRVRTSASAPATRTAGRIETGYLLLAGFTHSDTLAEVQWMADKVAGLRLFGDRDGRMNLGLDEVGGSILVVSQFTLYGDSRKGRRPTFSEAARPEVAIPLYDAFISAIRARGIHVETGEFGAMMEVESINDGPVSLWLERESSTVTRNAPDMTKPTPD